MLNFATGFAIVSKQLLSVVPSNARAFITLTQYTRKTRNLRKEEDDTRLLNKTTTKKINTETIYREIPSKLCTACI